MSDELLRYYNAELQFLRRQGDQFARTHPDLAAHLLLNSEASSDPYVGRLVQAFAYLNARTRLKLDDEFPEIAASLLDLVLPHYQRPIPSTSIVQLQLDSSQAEQFSGHSGIGGHRRRTLPLSDLLSSHLLALSHRGYQPAWGSL
jgi:type VI secretion system protein ImpG